ncbi:MAG TPA: glucose-6-phosphate dehydrogenase assembly protein OpcA [Candidatus Deferrimicrobiaceae bacterium]|nr:glucose-6-phosphate dehydrogenase assembly protein OpcA [Candidatus Deferrimicrobiaceae bacterium]
MGHELDRIWSSVSLTTRDDEGAEERRVAARSSVMNLVVVAGRAEVGERAASIVEGLSGRHPSRAVVVSQADPDGPAWLDAQIHAHCVLPAPGAPETCSELVYLTAGGQTGQHLAGVVAPLLIHDLPVTIWWPSEPRFESIQTRDLLALGDRILVDGSGWSGDGLRQLVQLAELPTRSQVQVTDFALVRQTRWREAIASTFDRPALLPYLSSLRSIQVRYAARDSAPGRTNIVKPLYHVAWLASRLGLTIDRQLEQDGRADGYRAVLKSRHRRISVVLRPAESVAPPGTTLAVNLRCERRASILEIDVTALAEGVVVRAAVDGKAMPERRFHAHRQRESDLLAQSLDEAGLDRVGAAALAAAAELVDEMVHVAPGRAH